MNITAYFSMDFKAIDFRNIESWPQPIKNTVLVALSLFSLSVFFLLFTMSQYSVLSSAQLQESQLKNTLLIDIPKEVLLTAQKKQLTQLQTLIKKYSVFLPATDQLGTLLDNVTLASTNSQLSLTELKPQTMVPNDFYTTVPIKVALSGTYQQFGEFFDQLAHLPYYIYPSELTINLPASASSANGQASDTLDAQMTILMYSPLAQAPT